MIYSSMALHPDATRFLVATGQVSGHGNGVTRLPHIRIWNSNTLETLHIIEAGFERQIVALAFSIEDNGLSVSLYKWKNILFLDTWLYNNIG